MDIELVWHGVYGQEELDGFVPVVLADLRRNFSEDALGNPMGMPAEDLLFHHVFLTEDMDGPCVFVWGVKGDPRFHCQYVLDPNADGCDLHVAEAEKKDT